MTIRWKLGLALVAVAVIPTAVSGVTAITISTSALEAAADDAHRRAAEEAATFIARFLDEAERAVRLGATYADLADLSDEERRGALTILYLQLDALTAVALVDERGRGVVPTVYRTPDEGDDRQLARHEALTPIGHEEFASHIPIEQALGRGVGRSEVYTSDRGPRRLTFAVEVGGPSGTRWVLAAEVSLRDVESFLRLAAPSGGAAKLADGAGTVIVSSRGAPEGRVDDLWLSGANRAERFRADGEWHRGAVARVAGTPWRVVTRRPEAEALASTHRMRSQAALWTGVGLFVALFLGFVISGGLAAPVRRLAEATRRIASGDLEARVAVGGRDEIASLGHAFNEMTAEIQRNRDEIEAWNRELAARVEARTKEIEELQVVLQRSHRMAAVAALGAGVAHEINNPLTGVLGFAQLLLRRAAPDSPERESLEAIVAQSMRIREVVASLMRLTAESEQAQEHVDLEKLVGQCLDLRSTSHADKKIEVRTSLQKVPAVLGRAADLQQAVLHLLDNAREAMLDGGVLTVGLEALAEGAVRLRLADTGRGISKEHVDRVFDPFFTTKTERWEAKGLGLPVTHRIVEEHGGRITIESEEGKGTTVSITLPTAVKGSLLD